jgi:GH15 family glucan-1,4-alpha-glucosidase
MSGLDLALIGNCTVGVLVDPRGTWTWGCLPRFDGDPMFCSLMNPRADNRDRGYFAVELTDLEQVQQSYERNTAILLTRLHDRRGGVVEVIDFAPRFYQFGRMFCPTTLVRIVRRVSGSPRIRLRLRPACDYGSGRPYMTCGSNHVRFVAGGYVVRATMDCSITALIEETPFVLQDTVSIVMGPDETMQGAPADVARRFYDDTASYWQTWVRSLWIPFEWQDEIIRAAITLKLNAYQDTGAIIAAVTSSIPEAVGSGRNWDYRFCWLRDAHFVINALNRLSKTRTMERYLAFIINVSAGAQNGRLQPVYRISGSPRMEEREVPGLAGYQDMGPVREGNQAHLQLQYDIYGASVLAATHMFFDRRIARSGDEALLRQLEPLGDAAAQLYDQPDAGPWELRGATRVHTYSSVMCWVACDRLAKIATRLALRDRAHHWRSKADRIHRVICERAWNPRRRSFTAAFEDERLDASLLLLNEVGFLRADDPRFIGTVAGIESELRRGDLVFRYTEADDFGVPQNAFVVCTFWYIDALAALGRRDEARELFQSMLRRCNRHGLLSEHIDPHTGAQWGNFPQTYSMVGLINSGMRLSIPWDQAY